MLDSSVQECGLPGSPRLTHTQVQCCESIGLTSRISETFETSETRQLSMFSVEDFPARTSASQERAPASLVSGQDYGASTPELLAKYDHDTSLWKTSQRCLLEGLATFSETWPRSGLMRSGTAYRLQPLVRLTDGTDSGLLATPTTKANQLAPSMMKHPGCRNLMWPTPTSRDWKDGSATACANVPVNGLLGRVVHQFPTPTASRRTGLQSHGRNVVTGSLNPTWVEWLMGYPLEWTALKPSAMPSSRKSRKSSGGQS